jgi:hypothetical protein
MVGMFAVWPVCGFKPGRGDGFLRVIQICSMPKEDEVKLEAQCCRILRHVKELCDV